MSRSPPAIEYRELRRADLPSFDELIPQGLGELERATGLDQLAITQFKSLHRISIWTIFSILRAMKRPPIRIFVGAEENRVLGTASLTLLQKAGYILGVATDSAARGRGIATTLLTRLCLETWRKGRPWAVLDVESDNVTALRVYRRLGFEEKAKFGWYVGRSPTTKADSSAAVTEVPRSQIQEVAAQVNSVLLPAIRDALPASPSRLSHLEILTRLRRAPARTWQLSSSGQFMAALRAFCVPAVKTGYVLPVACDPTLSKEALLALVTPALTWASSLGATRTVTVISDPPGEFDLVMAALGLNRAVSTTLMVRPSGGLGG
jgi:ribosomal protein S18 acetylase RimI-like enzyme